MSPRSNSRLQLRVGLDTLRLRVLAGRRVAQVLGEAELPWAGVAALADAVGTLLARLDVAAARGTELQVELCNALAHFDTVEGAFAGHGDAELDAIAGACVQEMLGAAHERDVRWQLQADERHLLICAIERPLLAALLALADRHGLRLRSIETSFALDWNRHGRAVKDGRAVFVSGDEGESVAALVNDGVVQALGTCAHPDELEEPQTPTRAVELLCNSVGLEHLAVPTRLDAQVARMLASLGLDLNGIERFIAVLAHDDPDSLSSRWTVHAPGAGA